MPAVDGDEHLLPGVPDGEHPDRATPAGPTTVCPGAVATTHVQLGQDVPVSVTDTGRQSGHAAQRH
ncbi:hypothetical protein Slala03_70420 [Streptomyces lavendulae subsp. lavendulae]|nr:hypothetical protein Slala03_70420 [Streptomyces lavendulae subsp. lavendulae]